jgi:hypothetical protein
MSRIEKLDSAGENFFLAWKHMFQGFAETGMAITGIEPEFS